MGNGPTSLSRSLPPSLLLASLYLPLIQPVRRYRWITPTGESTSYHRISDDQTEGSQLSEWKPNTHEEAAKRECDEEHHCVTAAGMGYREAFE